MKNLRRVRDFCREYPSFTESQMRWLRFCSVEGRKNSRGEPIPVNGFASVFVLVGKHLYVDIEEFQKKIDEKNSQTEAA